jgi:hypothetical protein
MTFHIVTYSTSPEKALYMFESAKFHGVEVRNLAPSTKWNGLRDKLIAIQSFIQELPEDDIFCFIDAYDVILNANTETILETFHSKGVELVFGAEVNLDPPSLKSLSYPESSTVFRYLNSGVYIGYIRAIRKMLAWGDYLQIENDQEYISRYYVEHHKDPSLHLDINASLVLNMFMIPWNALQIVSGFVKFPHYKTIPCFLHFNGMSYLDVDKDLIKNKNGYSFNYTKVYNRTFLAVLESKRFSKGLDIVCALTGKGNTY